MSYPEKSILIATNKWLKNLYVFLSTYVPKKWLLLFHNCWNWIDQIVWEEREQKMQFYWYYQCKRSNEKTNSSFPRVSALKCKTMLNEKIIIQTNFWDTQCALIKPFPVQSACCFPPEVLSFYRFHPVPKLHYPLGSH